MKRAGLVLACLGVAIAVLPGLDAAAAVPADAVLIERGRYLAIAGDCVACHTAPGGRPFAGGLPIATPVGAIMSTNITPSKTHGIGAYTEAQFADALREGMRADGQLLYPAMPYPAYARITDEDARSLYAWFMSAVAPVDTAPPPTNLPFPFNVRLSMAAWNLLFLDRRRFAADPGRSAEWNRGAYLADGLAHCGYCHTPRNLLMAEAPSREFAGADLGLWYAPNITSDANSGVGGWSEQDITGYLRTGRGAKGQAAGPMAEAIDHSLRHLTDADLGAIAAYMKTVPASRDAADSRPVTAWGAPADDLDSIRGVALPADQDRMSGPQLYDAWCATCHQPSGEGSFGGGLPRLFQTTALGRTNTNNLVMVMLEGVQRQTDMPMPGFAGELSDRQIATLGAYLVKHFGNPSAIVTAEQVRSLRAGGVPSSLILKARVGMVAVFVIAIGRLLIFAFRRRRNRG